MSCSPTSPHITVRRSCRSAGSAGEATITRSNDVSFCRQRVEGCLDLLLRNAQVRRNSMRGEWANSWVVKQLFNLPPVAALLILMSHLLISDLDPLAGTS